MMVAEISPVVLNPICNYVFDSLQRNGVDKHTGGSGFRGTGLLSWRWLKELDGARGRGIVRIDSCPYISSVYVGN